MTSTRYLGSITPPPPSVSVTGGGSIATKTGTWYFWLVNRCVGGFTKASTTSTAATVTASSQVQITIPSSARTSGSDIREFYILASNINDSTTASIIASYPGFLLTASAQSPSDYSETQTTLPALVTVSTDEQLNLAVTVADLASLPTGGDLLHGMPRLVSGDGGDQIYTYIANSPLDGWYPLIPQTFNPNVSNASDPGGYGCDRDVRAIPVADRNQIIYPAYDATGLSRSVPVIIANSNAGSSISSGKGVEVTAFVGQTDLTKYLKLTPRGIVDLTTGILDVSGQPSIGGSFAADGEGGSVIGLEKDLETGKGFWFDMYLEFSPEDTAGTLTSGSFVTFDAAFSPFNAKQTPDAGLFGDLIGPVEGYGRVIPNGLGLIPVITSRTGKVRGYTFPPYGGVLGQQDIVGVQSNTANQNIVVSSNGTAYKSDTTPSTASLRAIISTEDGVGAATAFAGSYVVDSTKRLNITINNPDTVRPDYPDILGAKQQTASLNASAVRIYTRPVGGGTITYYDKTITRAASEVVTIGDTTGNTGTLPTVDADFGLFAVESYSGAVVAGASTFSSSTIEVAIAYIYTGTVTRIAHDPDTLKAEATSQGDATRYIREASSSLWELFALVDAIGSPLSTVVEAEALTAEELAVSKLFFVAETEKIYYWNPSSTATADGIKTIAVTGIATGRLISVSGTGGALTTNALTADATLSEIEGTQYFVDSSSSVTGLTLTLPLVAGLDPSIRYRLLRTDTEPRTVSITCSGGDTINNGEATTFPLGFGEIIEIVPNPDLSGYFVSAIETSADISSKRTKLKSYTEFYIKSTGDDNNTGLSSSNALKTIEGLARKMQGIDVNGQSVGVYLEPGDAIDLKTTTADVQLIIYNSETTVCYFDFYGDTLLPPEISFNKLGNMLYLGGDNVYFSFYNTDLLIAHNTLYYALISASYNAIPCLLFLNTMTIRRSLGITTLTSIFFGNGYWSRVALYTDALTVECPLSRLYQIKDGYAYHRSTLILDSFTGEIFRGEKSFIEIEAGTTFTLSTSSKQYVLERDSVLQTNGVTIPGTAGDLEYSCRIGEIPSYGFQVTNLGSYNSTQSVTWDLSRGSIAGDAKLTITAGTITLAISNPPYLGDYTLTGILDIDVSTGGNLILPAGWSLTEDSVNPNDVTGIYQFIARRSTLNSATYVTFMPVNVNVTPIGSLSMLGNGTATTIGSISVAVKAAGTTTANGLNKLFTHSNNRLTYSGNKTTIFCATCIAKLSASASNEIGIVLYKNGSPLTDSPVSIIADGSGLSSVLTSQTIVQLAKTDYLEVWVINKTAAANITAIDLNLIVKPI